MNDERKETIEGINSLLSETKDKIDKGNITREEALESLNRQILETPYPDTVTQKLIYLGFTRVPASIKYHGNYTGGLFDHSLAVAMYLCKLTEQMNLTWFKNHSPYVVGMLHDMCKVDAYVLNEVKKESKEQKTFLDWDYNSYKSPYPGHGVKSVLLIEERIIDLTRQEKLCILHHMGAYEREMWSEYDAAIREDPNVLWTHSADMYASKVLGI